MQIFLNKIFNPQSLIQTPVKYHHTVYLQGLDRDVFEKSDGAASPLFTSRARGNAKTTAGACLRELENITCPYSGVKMISPAKMKQIEYKLGMCKTISEQVAVLEPYSPCMQKIEETMFKIFKEYAGKNPNDSMTDCLNSLKPECLAELKVEQLNVLNDIDGISNNLDAKTALTVRTLTTDARYRIIHDDSGFIFRRKDLLNNLGASTRSCPDKKTITQIWETADELPKSTTNLNAFVVKYSQRGSRETANRLLLPSMASIEHITPASLSGKNSLENFMTVSRAWNSDRGNMSMPEYIKQHPDIPQNTQKYADDIITSIESGKLTDCDWYPYVLKETLYNESKGLIDLDLSKYHISEERALTSVPEKIKTRYLKLKQQRAN